MIKLIVRTFVICIFIVLLFLPQEVSSLQDGILPCHQQVNLFSEYDRIFQKVASETGVDWHLLCAISYYETGYRCGIQSRKGAIGLMQIMPSTAKYFNIPVKHLDDPLLNVIVSAKLLKKIENSLNLNQVPDNDKIKIILAGYNSGLANLKNARKLAAQAGINYNDWEQLKYFGRINNSQTRQFVANVYNKWNEYNLLTASSF